MNAIRNYSALLFSYINLLNLLNLQDLRGQLLALGRFQISSPWSRPLTDSKPLTVLVFFLVFGQSFLGKVCRNPTALRWVARFVAIRPRSDESLDLGRWFSVVRSCKCSCPLAPLHNRSRLSSASPSSRCRVCRAIVRDFGRSVLACVNRSRLSAPRTASGPRQNLSTNRLRTRIWPSTRITLDHLATTRSSTLGKLLALLGNLRLALPRAAMVGWSWCWHSKSHVGCVQATLFSHHYDDSSGSFVERELQLSLHQYRIRKGVDLQVVSY